MDKVLIVEDDRLIAELERDYLEAAGFSVKIMADGTGVVEEMKKETYSAVILDVMLPGKNGFDICREARKEMNIPIIMVTAKKEDIDKIRGLGLEADDYMIKPFSPAELVARVKSHIQIHSMLLAQKRKEEEKGMEIGPLKILPRERRIFVGGKEIFLSNKEFDLLLFLAENPNIVFSKDTLFERIWGLDAVGNTATVTVHINRLREKLESGPVPVSFIQTVWGAGYRFKVG